jgi:glutamate racemase
MSQRDPIGVFDSGIGGLTVVRELVRQLPHERIIYFGDTARVPYGPKSPDTVRRYSNEIATWLTQQHVKVIVVACNTATAHALEHLQRDFPLPVIGVVQPGARAAVCASRNRRIGVIGTLGTINAISSEAEVVAQACPLFVPLVEEGWLDTEATRLIAREYLQPFTSDHIDTLVLGCTHYPLLKPMLAELVGREVRLIDSAEETAAETCRVLTERGLVAPPGSVGTHRFVASDAPDHFLRQGQRFLGAAIDEVEKVTLG